MYRNFLATLAAALSFALVVNSQAVSHKLRVTDRALAESLIAQGGRLLADYQSFQLFEVDELPVTKNTSANRPQTADHFNTIELNAKTLDTSVREISTMRRAA